MTHVRTRFAPSPTGYLHVGGARTALFCWLYARRFDGEFVLRVEDTDLSRSTDQARQAILDGMSWLGLDYDEGPTYQTDRFERYAEVAQRLIDAGKAYRCYCSAERVDAIRDEQVRLGLKPRYDGHCRNRSEPPPPDVEPAIRFRNPDDGEVVFDDLVFGRISVSNRELDDLIVLRPSGAPMYNFAVVVDDIDMRISHVVRGDDHLNNTPRQINIFNALGAEIPTFAHLPLIRGGDGKKLSKRHGAVSVTQFRDDGYLPGALLNYLARLGWSHGDQEIFAESELTRLFDLADVNRSAAVFDEEKLRWVNQHYIKAAEQEQLVALLVDQYRRIGVDIANGPAVGEVVEAFRERAQTMREMAENTRYLFEEFDEFEEKAAKKNLTVSSGVPLQRLGEVLTEAPWQPEALHGAVQSVAEELELKMGKVAQPLRVAISGRAATPPIDTTLALVGRERTLARLRRAQEYVARRAES